MASDIDRKTGLSLRLSDRQRRPQREIAELLRQVIAAKVPPLDGRRAPWKRDERLRH